MDLYPDISQWAGLSQKQLDWMRGQGVSIGAMIHPEPIRVATGTAGNDGRFEESDGGAPWLVFSEPTDAVFWQPKTGELATWHRPVFALGEAVIDNAATYAFDGNLNVFASPLDWLRARRDGIVVLDWSAAYRRLQDAPRVAVAEAVLFQYRRHMKPRLPETSVLVSVADERRAA